MNKHTTAETLLDEVFYGVRLVVLYVESNRQKTWNTYLGGGSVSRKVIKKQRVCEGTEMWKVV
jgi:hypothetical protein